MPAPSMYADLGGQMQTNKQEALRLAEAAKHVEAVIKLYDPAFNAQTIAARRRVRGNPWFKRGTMFRYALDALRRATTPMTVSEVTAAVMAARKIADATKEQRQGLKAGVRSCLERNVGKTVQRPGKACRSGGPSADFRGQSSRESGGNPI